MDRFGKEIAIPKLHFLPHIVDDVRNFDVHLDALSAYPFENQQRFYRDASTQYLLNIIPSILIILS